jgi:polyhydroxybutyrate depolymerase
MVRAVMWTALPAGDPAPCRAGHVRYRWVTARRVAAALGLAWCLALAPVPGRAETREQLVLDVGGEARSFYLVRPSRALEGPLPVVFCMHGSGVSQELMEQRTGFNALAEAEGFLVVYPEGRRRRWDDGRRRTTPVTVQASDDLRFVDALIDHVLARHGGDPRRVYVTGIANGGLMAHLAATQLSNKVAAIAPITRAITDKFVAEAHMQHPVSVLMVIGDRDPQSPFAGGEMRGEGFAFRLTSVEDTAAFYARALGARPAGEQAWLPADLHSRGRVVWRREYAGGTNGGEVVLYVIGGMGHAWPDWNVDTGRLIWTFFARHARA